MGGVRRQRKYKSCDPFCKQQKTVKKNDETFDCPPTGKNIKDEHFEETPAFRRFQESLERVNKKKHKRSDDTDQTEIRQPKKKATNKLRGETDQEYMRRLDDKIQEAFCKADGTCKTLRKKRKQHLKAREKKKKTAEKKLKEERSNDFHALKDDVKFGERVDAPPNLTAAPRKASKIKSSFNGLHLASILEKNGEKPATTDLKRRREMTEAEKESFDTERQRVIDAYRLSKKRKEMKHLT